MTWTAAAFVSRSPVGGVSRGSAWAAEDSEEAGWEWGWGWECGGAEVSAEVRSRGVVLLIVSGPRPLNRLMIF